MSPEQTFLTELEKKRKKLLKQLGQGEQIQNLTAAPEWQFFSEWLEATKSVLNKRIVGQNFINDHNGYLFTVGAIQAIDTILDGVERFKKAYTEAGPKLNELSKTMDEVQ